MIESNFSKKNSTTQCEMVKECLKDRDLVTVFNLKAMSEGGGTTDIDKAVLKALLKGKSSCHYIKFMSEVLQILIRPYSKHC